MADHEVDLGTAGASARREHERRREKREAATRERHPHTGNLLLRVQSAPASEVAWSTGAAGEEALAAHLARRCPDALVLHDRRIPRSRGSSTPQTRAAAAVCRCFGLSRSTPSLSTRPANSPSAWTRREPWALNPAARLLNS